jgi:heavy metal sensor kinase
MRSGVRRGAIATRWIRGLRPRLTFSYVLIFTLLLSLIGLFFTTQLRAIYQEQARQLLTEEWGAIRGYLRFEKGKVVWFYDPHDPEETFTVERLRRVYLLTDPSGRKIEVSPLYERELGIDDPGEIRRIVKSGAPVWSIRDGVQGVPFLIRSGAVVEEKHLYYLAIGRSLADSNRIVEEFTRNYFVGVPLLILLGSLIGWFIAGRALQPLDQIADTAQRVSGENLQSQIALRGTGDELDRLIEAFNRMIQRLETSFTQTRQFSTDVSHELRTPLTAIRGQLEVALFTSSTVEQYRDAIVNALEDTERLSQTIRALLLLSQAESGQLALQKTAFDLADVVADIVDQFGIPAEAARIELTSSLDDPCIVLADRVQIERLISNLLSNAVKYTRVGGRVAVAVRCAGDDVDIVISDTGVGISPDHLPHIFDRFYRVPGSDVSTPGAASVERGLGLGLSFVAWIVKAHEGRIDVESRLGQGTTFRVSLPGVRAAELTPEAPAVATG